MTKDKNHYPVIIIGGGPAGIATSITLTARGINNCLVDANLIPKEKLGEALPPNAKPILKKLGIKALVEHPKHMAYYGNKTCWGSPALDEKEFLKGIYGHGYLLNRTYFENQLWAHAEKYGGDFYPGYKLKQLKRLENGITVLIKDDTTLRSLTTNYIVDATGRKATVCRQLGVKKRELDTQFVMSFQINLEEELERQIFVEAVENGWWYAAPQENKVLSLMFFTKKALIPDKNETHNFLSAQINTTIHLSKLLKTQNMTFDRLRIMPAGTSRLGCPYGENWLAVGDAAYSYDPISSYGITSALASGFYGGHALASALENESEAFVSYQYLMEKAFENYLENLLVHYSSEKRWQSSTYWDRFN